MLALVVLIFGIRPIEHFERDADRSRTAWRSFEYKRIYFSDTRQSSSRVNSSELGAKTGRLSSGSAI